jgi:hypothetical protein
MVMRHPLCTRRLRHLLPVPCTQCRALFAADEAAFQAELAKVKLRHIDERHLREAQAARWLPAFPPQQAQTYDQHREAQRREAKRLAKLNEALTRHDQNRELGLYRAGVYPDLCEPEPFYPPLYADTFDTTNPTPNVADTSSSDSTDTSSTPDPTPDYNGGGGSFGGGGSSGDW